MVAVSLAFDMNFYRAHRKNIILPMVKGEHTAKSFGLGKMGIYR
jgi:hypothetical protein